MENEKVKKGKYIILLIYKGERMKKIEGIFCNLLFLMLFFHPFISNLDKKKW